MSKNKFMARLLKHEGAVVGNYNPHLSVVTSPSPSVNFVFGNGWGLPLGYSMVLYGPPKAGKTLLVNAMVGQLHRDDPDAIVVKYDTEFREEAQNTPQTRSAWGIDEDRYVAYQVNEPNLIFDHIEKEIAAMVDDGAPIKMIIIDSVSGIQGRRAMNADSVMQQQIGDNAATIQEGLKRIIPIIHRKKIAMVMTTQIRAEMDMAEQMRGKKDKMAGAFALKHAAEYFVRVEKNQSKGGRTSLDGSEYVDDSVRDLMDHGESTGHKIRVKMEDSSLGPKGRVGEFTLDYRRGIINTHEEIFLLGVNRGVIETPNQSAYVFKGTKWTGKQTMLGALKDDPKLAKEVLYEVRLRDMQNNLPTPPSKEESSEESSS